MSEPSASDACGDHVVLLGPQLCARRNTFGRTFSSLGGGKVHTACSSWLSDFMSLAIEHCDDLLSYFKRKIDTMRMSMVGALA